MNICITAFDSDPFVVFPIIHKINDNSVIYSFGFNEVWPCLDCLII